MSSQWDPSACREFLRQVMSLERQSALCMMGRSRDGQCEDGRLTPIEPWESLFSPVVEKRPDGATDAEIVSFALRIRGCYSKQCLMRLLEIVKEVPDGGAVCEIGVWHGRSASVLLLEQYARLKRPRTRASLCAGVCQAPEEASYSDRLRPAGITVHLVDSWEDEEARVPCERLIGELAKDTRSDVYCHWMPSECAAASIPELDLLHIDGGHGEQVGADCRLYLPKVRVGGLVVFHDYGDESAYPAVTAAVESMVVGAPQRWTVLGVVENQLAARRIGLD